MSDQPTPPIIPEKLTGIKTGTPAEYAAGPKAIKKAVDHLMSEMGPVRAFQAINRMNKKDGFDCPGCAWPDPDDKRSVLGEYCENGAKALAEEATLKTVTPSFFQKHSIQEMKVWSDFEIGKKGRLTTPMIIRKGSDHYEAIDWNDAFEIVSQHLSQLNHSNEAIFYTSGRSSNEAAYLYSLFARRFGTNNLPDCSNMCHESSGVGLSQTLGIGKGSVKLDDLHKAEVIMIIGQNPGTNHPRMLNSLQKAKDNGAKVITINPLEEAGLKRFRNPQKVVDYFTSGTTITDAYLQVRVNEDITLLKALMLGLLEAEDAQGNVLDKDFISKQTSGYDDFLAYLKQHSVAELLKKSGIATKDYHQALQILIPAKRIIICWAMGLTQHKNGVDNIKECVNLLLMKGSIGKEGAGTCPVRGHSNVQGDRTVGINHHLAPAMAKKLKDLYQFDPPLEDGFDVVHSIQAMHKGNAKFFMALGGNLLSAASDTNFTAKALQNCDLTVSISTKLNRTHLYPGKVGLILPTLGRSEKDHTGGLTQKVTVENSMGKVHTSAGMLHPISDNLMSEPAIICQMAITHFGDQTNINWEAFKNNYNLIRDDIAKVITGFEDYNNRVSNGKEFYLPNNARDGDFSKMPNGRAIFSICEAPNHNLQPDEFLLTTVRSHDQFNTTIYGLDDRYRGVYNERRVVFMNKTDMERLQLQHLDLIDLISYYKGVERSVSKFHVLAYSIPSQNLAAYFPETNPLIPIDEFADGSNTPISKSVRVKVQKTPD